MRHFLGSLVPRSRSTLIRGACLAVAAMLTAVALAAQEATEADPFATAATLDREALQAAVLRRNPNLAAARAAVAAAEARPAQVSALDDLSVSYGVAPLSIGSSAVDFGYRAEAMQMLPLRGRRPLQRTVANDEAEQARQELAALRLELAERASLLYDDFYLVRRAQAITAEHAALVADLLSVATARYAAGFASQQEPLQAEVELAHLQHDQVVLLSEEQTIRAELDALLHRSSEAPLPPPPETLPAPPEESPDAAQLVERARAARPELFAADAAIRSREAELELARLGGRPELGVSAGYDSMWSDGEHRFMVGGSLRWPVWKKRVRAAVVEAEARLLEAEAARQARIDEVRRDVTVAAARLREAHHVIDIFQSRLLPASRDQVRAARAGFEAGRDDFLAVITAARGLRSYELSYHEALAGLYRTHAGLERAVGAEPASGRRQAAVNDRDPVRSSVPPEGDAP